MMHRSQDGKTALMTILRRARVCVRSPPKKETLRDSDVCEMSRPLTKLVRSKTSLAATLEGEGLAVFDGALGTARCADLRGEIDMLHFTGKLLDRCGAAPDLCQSFAMHIATMRTLICTRPAQTNLQPSATRTPARRKSSL